MAIDRTIKPPYMPTQYDIPLLPLPYDFETKAVLKQLNLANKKLAELKGVALTIPNEDILINSLTLQEAKDSRPATIKARKPKYFFTIYVFVRLCIIQIQKAVPAWDFPIQHLPV